MKFKYIGTDRVMRAFGYDFTDGAMPDVTDDHAIKKLSGNRFFEAIPEQGPPVDDDLQRDIAVLRDLGVLPYKELVKFSRAEMAEYAAAMGIEIDQNQTIFKMVKQFRERLDAVWAKNGDDHGTKE